MSKTRPHANRTSPPSNLLINRLHEILLLPIFKRDRSCPARPTSQHSSIPFSSLLHSRWDNTLLSHHSFRLEPHPLSQPDGRFVRSVCLPLQSPQTQSTSERVGRACKGRGEGLDIAVPRCRADEARLDVGPFRHIRVVKGIVLDQSDCMGGDMRFLCSRKDENVACSRVVERPSISQAQLIII
jgi:hypothetical protein